MEAKQDEQYKQTGKSQDYSVNIMGPGPSDMHWVLKMGAGKKARGRSLIHTRSGTVLGHVEPYRGGGSQVMTDGKLEYVKGWWVTVIDCKPPFTIEGFRCKEWNTHRATLEECIDLIKTAKGLEDGEVR